MSALGKPGQRQPVQQEPRRLFAEHLCPLLLLPTARTGCHPRSQREQGALRCSWHRGHCGGCRGSARNQEGAAALLSHVPPAVTDEGPRDGDYPDACCSEAPEHGEHISQSGTVTVSVYHTCSSESCRWGSPLGFRPSLPESGTASPKTREHCSSSKWRSFKGPHGWAFAQMPEHRAGGNATRNVLEPGARSGLRNHHPVAPRVAVLRLARQKRFRAAGCTAEVRRGGPPYSHRGRSRGRDGRLRAPHRRLWALCVEEREREREGLFPCLRGCVSQGSVEQSLEVPGRTTPS